MSILKLKTAPASEPISVDEVKDQIRMETDFTAHDTLIAAYIKSAREYVEQLCGPLVTQTWYQYEQAWPSGTVLSLGKPHVQSLTSVKYTDEDGTQTTFAGTNYTLSIVDEYKPTITLKEDSDWPTVTLFNVDPIVLEFVCGYGAADAVPEPIRIALLLYVQHLYDGTPLAGAFDALITNYRVWS